jgi:hypothetical protein
MILIISKKVVESKKKKGPWNPWAICNTSVGTEESDKREGAFTTSKIRTKTKATQQKVKIK